MARLPSPVASREVVGCDSCFLVQFRTSNNLCRRCHTSLDEDEEVLEPVTPTPTLVPPLENIPGHLRLASSIRSFRLRGGMSQRQLAARMSVPRTYVSKIENEKACPTLSSLERLWKGRRNTVPL